MDGFQNLMDSATADIKAQMAERGLQQTPHDAFTGFFHAINWQEPFIVALVTWHVLVLLGALGTSRFIIPHAVLFVVLCLLVLCAQPLNALGAAQWQDIATQNYFDDGGVFVSLTFSLPTMVVLMGMLVNIVWSAGSLMIKVKRAEVARRKPKAD